MPAARPPWIQAALPLRAIDGGFAPADTSGGWMGGAELSVRAGFGLDGVIGQAGDGLVFGSIGLRSDTRSSSSSR